MEVVHPLTPLLRSAPLLQGERGRRTWRMSRFTSVLDFWKLRHLYLDAHPLPTSPLKGEGYTDSEKFRKSYGIFPSGTSTTQYGFWKWTESVQKAKREGIHYAEALGQELVVRLNQQS